MQSISDKSAEVATIPPAGEVVSFNAERLKRATVDTLLDELVPVAFGDLRQCFDDSGELLPRSQWPADAHKLVKRSRAMDNTTSIERVDPLPALSMLLRLTSAKSRHDPINNGKQR